MQSRFLDNIEARISTETDEIAIDCLLAEKAGYLARLGKVDEAREILDNIGSRNFARPNVERSVYVNLAEGVASFYSDMGSAAYDRFRRAQALSEAAGLPALRATASGWLAHLAFGRHDFVLMAREIETALRLAKPDSHACLSRVSLVMGQALHLANQSNSTKWYFRARSHALEIGDETIISAVIHNMAMIGVASARQRMLQRGVLSKDASIGAMSVDSTRNFDELVGITSLDSLTPMLQAQALSLEGRFEEALILYSAHMKSALSQGMERIECWLLADQLWCRVNIGITQGALSDIQTILSRMSNVQIDDLAATHSRLAQIYSFIEGEEQSTHHRKIAEELWATYCELQSEIVSHLRDIDESNLY